MPRKKKVPNKLPPKFYLFRVRGYNSTKDPEPLKIEFQMKYGHTRMFLEITQTTTLKDLKHYWSVIKEQQTRLRESEGIVVERPMDRFINDLHELHRTGKSYQAISKELNHELKSHLEKHLAYCRSEAKKQGIIIDTIIDKDHTGYYNDANYLLAAMGIKNPDPDDSAQSIHDWCKKMLLLLERKPWPFSYYDFPITKEHVRERIRYCRELLNS